MALFKRKKKKIAVLHYDWKETVEWLEVKKALRHLGVTVYIHTINTGNDDFAVVLSKTDLTNQEAKKQYLDTWDKLDEFDDQ